MCPLSGRKERQAFEPPTNDRKGHIGDGQSQRKDGGNERRQNRAFFRIDKGKCGNDKAYHVGT